MLAVCVTWDKQVHEIRSRVSATLGLSGSAGSFSLESPCLEATGNSGNQSPGQCEVNARQAAVDHDSPLCVFMGLELGRFILYFYLRSQIFKMFMFLSGGFGSNTG